MKKKQSGFTLIELIMVIVVLGILAAFALPRFADFSNQARASAIEGLAGSLRSGAAIAHSAQLATGAAEGALIQLEGQDVQLADGFPTSASIVVAAQVDGFDISPSPVVAADPVTFTPAGYTGGTCQVVYTPSGASGTAPTIAVDTSGC